MEMNIQKMHEEEGKAYAELEAAVLAERKAKARTMKAQYDLDYWRDELKAKRYELMAV